MSTKYSKIYINPLISLKRNKEEFVAKKNLSRVSGHSFFEYLISKEGVCLDVGCRDFDFSNHVKDLCQKVVAIDPGFNIKPPENLKFHMDKDEKDP